MKILRNRRAVAMIELIFAIVIMGFVMMSAPMLISQATQSSIVLTQQEAIAAAGTRMGLILTRAWDEQNTDIDAPVLATDSSSTSLRGDVTIGRRAGTPPLSKRSIYSNSTGVEVNASALGVDANETAGNEAEADDVDDYNGVTIYLEGASSTDDDYKDASLKITSSVNYSTDIPTSTDKYNGEIITFPDIINSTTSAGTSNIKHISIQALSDSNGSLDTQITLHAFSCNIGTFELDRRVFP